MVDYSYDPDDYRPRYDRRDDWRMEALIDEARRQLDRDDRREDPLVRVVNDPNITITPAIAKAINDPKKIMTPDRQIVKAMKVQRAALYPPVNGKRTRKKTKTDRTMSSCLKEANAKARKKNGSMKKGWSQAKIMKEAHRMCRKKMGTRKGMVRKTARRAYEKK